MLYFINNETVTDRKDRNSWTETVTEKNKKQELRLELKTISQLTLNIKVY